MSKTRIVATFGPACAAPGTLTEMIAAGVDVVRINCSHGEPADRVAAVAAVRAAADAAGRRVAILADLQGPKIRVGVLPGSVTLTTGSTVTLRAGVDTAEDGVIPVVYPAFAADLVPGDRVLLHDGLLELRVLSSDGTTVTAQVIRGGQLSSRKGINMPGAAVSATSPTDKDYEDLERMLAVGVDYVALSFVRSGADGRRLRTRIAELGGDVRIIAKLERPEALESLEEILDVFDAIMVARGDLGVELPLDEVPIAQKRIIAAANAAGVPVITATEMLESMVTTGRPTRAEASDVANAVFDGTDAVMLSGETASGAHPVQAVAYMRRICDTAEAHTAFFRPVSELAHNATPSQAVAHAVTRAAADLGAAAIVVYSETGETARFIAANRPATRMLLLSSHERTLARSCLYRGARPRLVADLGSLERQIAVANAVVLETEIAKPGDVIVVVSGAPGQAGGTNRMSVHTVTE